MKIGIIGAVKTEIIFLRKKIKKCTIKEIGNHKFYNGYLHGINIIILKSGIGKVSASMVTTLLISCYNPDIIINIGSAGSINSLLKIQDTIIPNRTSYYDVDVSIFNYSIGQIPKYPKFFFVNSELLDIAKKCMYKLDYIFKSGLILTGDSFIHKKNVLLSIIKHFPSAVAIDMESAAIAQVCYNFKKPMLIIRAISDCANKYAAFNFKKNIEKASHHASIIIEEILKNI